MKVLSRLLVILVLAMSAVVVSESPPAKAEGVCGSWSSLGGATPGNPTTAIDAFGRIEVFARGTDNSLFHSNQLISNTCDSTAWNSWEPIGSNGALTSEPAVGRNRDGRLEVFFRGADGSTLFHQMQSAPGSRTWGPPSPLGGPVTSDPAVATNQDGRLEVFVRRPDNTISHRAQTAPNATTWGPWFTLGGFATSDPVVATNQDGRLQVFARGSDNALWYRSQRTPNTTSDWTFTPGGGWTSLGGLIIANEAVRSAAPRVAAVEREGDGRLHVFVIGPDRGVWHRYQLWPGSDSWSFTPDGDWSSLGGVATSAVETRRNRDGRLEVFARGTDNNLWHRLENRANASENWAEWDRMSFHTFLPLPIGLVVTGDPALAVNADGRLEAFVRGQYDQVFHRAQ